MMGTTGTDLNMRAKMIRIVMTPSFRMATIEIVGNPMTWTTWITLMIQATTGACYFMEMVTVRTMMMFTSTTRAAA